jgi:hypothetical protein
MTTPIELQAIRARVAHLEAHRVELLPHPAYLTQAEKDRARLLSAVEAALRVADALDVMASGKSIPARILGPSFKVMATNIRDAIAEALGAES